MAAMPKFIECSFPAPLAYGAEGGPRFNTQIVTKGEGSENRNATWGPDGREEYQVQAIPCEKPDHDAVLALFRVVQGRLVGFRFKSPIDSHVENEPIDTTGTRIVGPSNSVPAADLYQLRKAYSICGHTQYRKIIKPISGTVTLLLKRQGETVYSVVTLAGGAIVGGGLYNQDLYNQNPTITADVTIDYTTGVITWNSASPPGANDSLIWTGDFEIPARFASDAWPARRVGHQAWAVDTAVVELAEQDAYV